MCEVTYDGDWIPVGEATRLVRSPRGRKTHTSTIIRWILSGRLEGRRRGRWWLVKRSEVIARAAGVPVVVQPVLPGIPTTRERQAQQRWAKNVLDKAGI